MSREIARDATWRVVCLAAGINFVLASVYIIRNSLELAGLLPFSHWTNSNLHYLIGYAAAGFYIFAFILLISRRLSFLPVYVAGAVMRWYFWVTQVQLEHFPVMIGFVALAVDALVLMTSMRWYLRPSSNR